MIQGPYKKCQGGALFLRFRRRNTVLRIFIRRRMGCARFLIRSRSVDHIRHRHMVTTNRPLDPVQAIEK
ncbi:hypothetical protein V6N13_067224 [Hibiscus sabdariffa]